MGAVRDDIAASLAEQVWERLARLEESHQQVLKAHEQVRRSLDESIATREESSLRAAWDQYRNVITDLDRVTEGIETLRMNAG